MSVIEHPHSTTTPCVWGRGAEGFVDAVGHRVEEFLSVQREALCDGHPEARLGVDALVEFVLRGGKRIRATFVHAGFVASGGDVHDARLVDLAASIELLHAFALIHDDVMDDSSTRRGAPTLHRRFATLHDTEGWRGERRRVAESFAVLLGDLAFALSIKMQRTLPRPVLDLLDTTRAELHVGQFLDLLSAADGRCNPDRIGAITMNKTARYTVRRPLQLGALLSGNQDHLGAFAVYGEAVGEAFQHRDDLIGVYADPDATGKPRFDDLFDAKATLLLHTARSARGAGKIRALDRIGTSRFTLTDARELAEFMRDCGAVATVERRIDELIDTAIGALASSQLGSVHRKRLESLARFAGHRSA